MKRMSMVGAALVVVAVVGLWLLYGGQIAGQPAKEDANREKEPRKVNTSGSATVRVKPNRARLFLAVETTDKTIKQARTANKKDVEAVIAAILALKIADLKMKTTNVQMDAVYSKPKEQTHAPEIVGYKATTTFTVLLANDEPQKLSAAATQVLDTALESGANALSQITFFRDDLTEARRQALTKATADAVANAKALTAGDNRSILDVISIDGNPEYVLASQTNAMQKQDDAGAGVSMVAGDVEVTCRVSITCTFGAGK